MDNNDEQAIEMVDTHCHIHESQFELTGDNPTRARWMRSEITDPDEMIREAASVGATRLLCVGTSVEDSILAASFVRDRPNTWASIGIHPHEAETYIDDNADLKLIEQLTVQPKIVAVGECGLDYYYNHSSHDAQKKILRFQIELALEHNLPMIFHVRDGKPKHDEPALSIKAFDDFWRVFDDYQGIRGVIHSFSASQKELEAILKRNLYVGLNGIMTFTKDEVQLAAAKAVPIGRLLLETDAPFLTPAPERGTICRPKHVRATAEFLAGVRGESLKHIASITTQNARSLFALA